MTASDEIPDVVLRNLFDEDSARLGGPGPDWVVLTCGYEGCGEEISGPPTGRGSAVMKLGLHRYTKHKIRKGDRPARPRPGAPTSDDIAGEGQTRMGQVISMVKDMADAAGGPAPDRPPTGDELTKALARGLTSITVLGASYAAETDPMIPQGPGAEQQIEDLVDYLSLPLKASQDVMAPIGRMLAPTRINKRYGRGIVRNIDVIGSGGELLTLVMHWRRYMAERRQWAAGQRPAPAPLAAVPDLPAAPTSPGPTAGRVLGPDDVLRMQQHNNPQGV